jgi:hypothetical protein
MVCVTTPRVGARSKGSIALRFASIRTWLYRSSIRRLTGGNDRAYSWSAVLFDGNGNLFGTAAEGGDTSRCLSPFGCGVVWEITP